MKNFEQSGLKNSVLEAIEQGKPVMGICVGEQIMFEGSEESPEVKGLGIFKGMVKNKCSWAKNSAYGLEFYCYR